MLHFVLWLAYLIDSSKAIKVGGKQKPYEMWQAGNSLAASPLANSSRASPERNIAALPPLARSRIPPATQASSTANSKHRWRENIRIWEKSVYTAKLSRFKSFRIQSSHFRFRIQNLRRHDQTGMFSFRIRPLVCKRQNQSGTKTFRIHKESGTISSSVTPSLNLPKRPWPFSWNLD